MTATPMPRHHPLSATLLAYAAGHLSPGMQLMVESHLAFCPRCRGELQAYEMEAGLALEALPPEALDVSCLENLLARIDEHGPPACIDVTVPVEVVDPRFPEPLRQHVGRRGEHILWRRLETGGRHGVIPEKQVGYFVEIAAPPAPALIAQDAVLLLLDGHFTVGKNTYHSGDVITARALKTLAITQGPVLFLVIAPPRGTLAQLISWLRRHVRRG